MKRYAPAVGLTAGGGICLTGGRWVTLAVLSLIFCSLVIFTCAVFRPGKFTVALDALLRTLLGRADADESLAEQFARLSDLTAERTDLTASAPDEIREGSQRCLGVAEAGTRASAWRGAPICKCRVAGRSAGAVQPGKPSAANGAWYAFDRSTPAARRTNSANSCTTPPHASHEIRPRESGHTRTTDRSPVPHGHDTA